MKTKQLVVIYIAFLWAGPILAEAAPVESFDTEASVANWRFHNGPEFPGAAGAIRWDATQGHTGAGCLVLEHDFTGGGNYVQAVGPLPAGVDAKVARVWLKKPSAHNITFRATDSAGQTFQKSVSYQSADWQQIEVDLTQWRLSFGGPGDNQIRPPFKQFGIIIENSAPSKSGALLIDDLEFLPQPSPVSVPVTYTAIDFLKPAGIRLQGGPGNTLDSSTWQYAFNPGAGPCVLSDFSLLGEPQSMRIHLESDGSGHGVQVTLASHYQSFHKEVATLTDRGEQIIEVPLGKLTGWDHFGGGNDGVARLPLRFRQISLIGKPGGPRTGTIKINRIEIVTLPRDGQRVVLVPDVVEEAGAVRFSVRAISLTPRNVKGMLRCDVRSFGRSLARHEAERTLQMDGPPAEWSVSQAMGDHRFIEAAFTWSDEDFTSKPVTIGTFALPGHPGSPELHPESFMGAGLYLYRYQWSPNYIEPITRVCELAQRAGVKWTREEIQWNTTEPVEGTFNWTFYDDVIDTARKHGISVYGLLCYWSGWAKKDTPEGVEQYCRWVRQVVRRYKDRVKHWEIWNEPNIFFWSGPHELYAQMLSQAYEAIKTEDPDAVVLGCSTAGIDSEFIRKVMGWGGKFDALTIHPYRGKLNDLGFIQELQDVRRLVDGREVWLTEMGWPSQLIDGVSERSQASLCARVYLCTAASGAGRNVSWYDFRNDSNDPFYHEMNFGLVRNDLRPKPGYGTLATLGRTIGQMRPKEQVEIPADAYGFRFTDGTKDVVAVCAPDTGRLLSFQAPAEIAVTNAFGETVEPVRTGNLSTVTLDAGFPIYLTGPAGFPFEDAAVPLSYSVSPIAVGAGGTFTFRIESTAELQDPSWDLPQGWPQPQKSGENTWRIVVPKDAPAYAFDIQAVVGLNDGALRLPARVTVAPSVLRL